MQGTNFIYGRADRRYKDTVFRKIFKDKEELLTLYNAINNTDYDNPDDLDVVTLENAIYMSMKNDVSCILDMTLQLFEHQSTVNPNMPVRILIYVTEQIKILLDKKNIYSRTMIKLPTPSFYVLYNGEEEQPEVKELKLSDAFKKSVDNPSLEVVVRQLNINRGYNKGLMDRCPTLMNYMIYVDRVRAYQKTMPLEEAVDRAIDECIEEDILSEFLSKNRAEVRNMFLYEYDEEKHKKFLREEGYADGFADGEATGKILVLHELGWEISDIAKKIGIEEATVQEIITEKS